MLKMLEVNPHIDYVILCLDHDNAGIETSEKFYDILTYKKIGCGKLMPEYKDWNEDLKASLNLPAIPAEEHPHYPLRDKICLEIYNLISQLKEKDISLQELNKLFQKTKTSNMEQVVETLKQLSAFSLLLAEKEYKQLGSSQDIDLVKNRFYHGFKAYENRSRLNNRLDMIGQEILKISGSEGIIPKDEKLNIAKAYEAIAQHSLKAIILIELQEQKQEQRQDQNQIKEMIM